MRRITLRNTTITTSHVGFGCVSLTTHNDPRRARDILELAYDRGITHFDTARAYGLGHSEAILGDFIRNKRESVTVTTKFGLQPQLPLSASATFVRAAKSILRHVPALERRVKKKVHRYVKAGAFEPPEAAKSLERSLRELHTDYVDLLLLHECTLDDATNDGLLRFLEDQMSRGSVRHVGVGTDHRQLRGDLDTFPTTYAVFQFENNPVHATLSRMKGADRRAIVTHGALQVLGRIHSAATSNSAVTARSSARANCDLADPAMLSALLLHYALRSNRDGVVLFATTRRDHLLANLRSITEQSFSDDQISVFVDFVAELTATPDLNVSGSTQ